MKKQLPHLNFGVPWQVHKSGALRALTTIVKRLTQVLWLTITDH